MRVAFVSCICTRLFPDQPVWTWIGGQQPDHLVLLGDSLYLDIATAVHPRDMSDNDFAVHLFSLYQELINQPTFLALVRSMTPGTVTSLWDDHDFLWNDACGAQVHPVHTGKVRLSTAFLEVFRTALATGLAPGSFPAMYNDPRFWDPNQPALTTPSIALGTDVWLHLSDGRTNRTFAFPLPEKKRTVFGKAQRDRFTAKIGSAPEAVHLFASGSTIAEYQRYDVDLAWIKALAAKQRMLVLSGDIHRNQLDGFYAGKLPLHEATSSGVAVKDAVVIGTRRQNYGLVDISAETVTMRLFAKNVEKERRVIDRTTWLPV
jgi:alkaline phosphatase D